MDILSFPKSAFHNSILLVITTVLPIVSTSTPLQEQVSELLRKRIEEAGRLSSISVGDEVVYASSALPVFYERRGFEPAWVIPQGDLRHIDQLIDQIRKADREGLRPTDYHLSQIGKLRKDLKVNSNPQVIVDLELLATDAFLMYGSHLLSGMVNPETIHSEWVANRRGTDLALILQNALDREAIKESLDALKPPQKGYTRLRGALHRYQAIQHNGGWQSVNSGEKLEPGASGEKVRQVQKRLMQSGDFPGTNADTIAVFDSETEQAVRRFQERHGLETDGVVGQATTDAMNVSVEERIHQVKLNLERWRWLPQDLGARHLIVNIANFCLDVEENSRTVLTMRVVVGRDYRKTPVFSDRMTYLVLNPSWNVPPSIATRDKLPEIKKNPEYLSKQKMKLLSGWGGETVVVDPGTVDWSKITAKNFSYRLVQDPGPLNALGQIKFMFPNRFNVYLHDTPSQQDFGKSTRAFSSGCIRVHKPIDLAEYLLGSDRDWGREKIFEALKTGKEQMVRLPEPIPVHLLYWTAWANDDGSIHFRKDIYSRDMRLFEAMNEEPPTPQSKDGN